MLDLSLVETGISDDSVPTLAGMPKLRALRLGVELSAASLESLRALRPDVLIQAMPSFHPGRGSGLIP